MAQVITVEALEATINRIRHENPPVGGRLSPELRILAEIYGRMIYERAREVDLDRLPENIRPAALQLLDRESALSSTRGR